MLYSRPIPPTSQKSIEEAVFASLLSGHDAPRAAVRVTHAYVHVHPHCGLSLFPVVFFPGAQQHFDPFSAQELYPCFLVCRAFRQAAQAEYLWEIRCKHELELAECNLNQSWFDTYKGENPIYLDQYLRF